MKKTKSLHSNEFVNTLLQGGQEKLGGKELEALNQTLLSLGTTEEKLQVISQLPIVCNFLDVVPHLKELFSSYSTEEKFVLYAVLALGQGEKVFQDENAFSLKNLTDLIKRLLVVERFYSHLGGLIGYQLVCMDLLSRKGERQKEGRYRAPKSIDISEEGELSRAAILAGLRHLEQLAEIYPLGGAADRLSLQKEDLADFQIAATLEFCEKSLLQRLIEDLQAREFLHFKLFSKQVSVPILLMTSEEKQGSQQVRQMLEEKQWFGRDKKNFFLFAQPLVPTMNTQGQWCSIGSGQLLFKPGGHGVIWKLAQELGAFDWLESRGKTKALLRQINNPIAGVDYGLVAFLGLGFLQDKAFGFAACPCAEGVSEGVNIVIETGEGSCLTNIEYCDFDEELKRAELLANTNLLFADLQVVQDLLKKCPIPGLLVNAKQVKYLDATGKVQEEEILRLESTMQNLADALVDPKSAVEKRSFITCNKREKTISSIKKEFAFGSSMLQTPEQCYLDVLKNARDLLVNACGFEVPSLHDPADFFDNGPPFIFLYHPALGPLYSIIGQKLRTGRLALSSELKLEIAELCVENLEVEGSLHIQTDAVMGHRDQQGLIQYSRRGGKCTLKNVSVYNRGIDRKASRSFWKDEITHHEKCVITIEEGGEFYAENIELVGQLEVHVPKNTKVVAFMDSGRLCLSKQPLSEPSWYWDYLINSENQLFLQMKKGE